MKTWNNHEAYADDKSQSASEMTTSFIYERAWNPRDLGYKCRGALQFTMQGSWVHAMIEREDAAVVRCQIGPHAERHKEIGSNRTLSGSSRPAYASRL